ncbi:phosphoribosylformylglycinamidine synthase-associated small membrane protein [Roseibium hamelinense]|nr:phosphoribosylformylglycinamidine synthase-associated small membrane protein [Roseibium hamelinense]
MDEDAAKALRFMAIKAAMFIALPAGAALLAVYFLL